jgi:PAS domain S-box-containing protein
MSAGWVAESSRTPRQQMTTSERDLAESTQRYRSLFLYNPHATFSLDLLGRYADANPAVERLSGYSLAELLRMDFTAVVHPEDLPHALIAFQAVVNREPRQLEARILHKDGHVIELSLTVVPVIVCDEVVGVHGVAEDTTERNEMRRELERTRRVAEETSVTKSLFLANMSHEVRTPLTSVLAATEMLADCDLASPERHFVEIIERSGERLLRLVNDILDFSRLEAGSVEVQDAPITLRAVAEEVACWAAPQAERKNLGFSWTLDPELPGYVSGDALRISQVLTNLLDNAVKFTQKGHVRLSLDVVSRHGNTAEVRFLVEDTGIGVPCEQIGYLFQSFTQADASSTRAYDGAGLGLAICQELVGLMNGSIWAESTPGAGSTFWFTLPLEVVESP